LFFLATSKNFPSVNIQEATLKKPARVYMRWYKMIRFFRIIVEKEKAYPLPLPAYQVFFRCCNFSLLHPFLLVEHTTTYTFIISDSMRLLQLPLFSLQKCNFFNTIFPRSLP
jgi:hypothetical protein